MATDDMKAKLRAMKEKMDSLVAEMLPEEGKIATETTETCMTRLKEYFGSSEQKFAEIFGHIAKQRKGYFSSHMMGPCQPERQPKDKKVQCLFVSTDQDLARVPLTGDEKEFKDMRTITTTGLADKKFGIDYRTKNENTIGQRIATNYTDAAASMQGIYAPGTTIYMWRHLMTTSAGPANNFLNTMDGTQKILDFKTTKDAERAFATKHDCTGICEGSVTGWTLKNASYVTTVCSEVLRGYLALADLSFVSAFVPGSRGFTPFVSHGDLERFISSEKKRIELESDASTAKLTEAKEKQFIKEEAEAMVTRMHSCELSELIMRTLLAQNAKPILDREVSFQVMNARRVQELYSSPAAVAYLNTHGLLSKAVTGPSVSSGPITLDNLISDHDIKDEEERVQRSRARYATRS